MASIFPLDAGKEVQERFTDKTINELVKACFDMGEARTGALIVIEQNIRLSEYERTGINVDAVLTSQLLINIFEHNTPLHDGAVLVRGNRIVAATCYLPLSDNMELSKQLGTRHRAGVGISEVSDSLTIIVSEETGQVSMAQNGQLSRGLTSAELRSALIKAQNKKVVTNSKLRHLDNPVSSKSITIAGENVELQNTAYVDSANMMCMQDDDPDPIRVTITGERRLLSRITQANITLTADLQQAGSLDTDPVMVPITASCPGISPENIKVTPQYLSVRLEEKVTQEFLVNVNYGSSQPGKGYEVGSQTASPEKVKITGPKSLVNKIDKVNATVDVDGRTKDFSEEAELNIIDKNQDSLAGRMAYLTIDNTKVVVTTKFWKIRTGVNIGADYVGVPADGYQVESVTTVPDTVSIAGTDEALETLKQNDNTIWIGGTDIDITGETTDIEKKVSLKDVLPEDVKLTSGTSEDVWVKVSILPIGSHSYGLPSNQVTVDNLADNLLVTFGTDKIEIRVKATDGELDDFNLDEVKASVDLKDMGVGSYQIPVTVKLPKGFELLDDVVADVTISEVSNSDTNNE